MPFKPNYTQQRGARNQTKELKKQQKLQRRIDEAVKRKAAQTKEEPSSGGDSGTA